MRVTGRRPPWETIWAIEGSLHKKRDFVVAQYVLFGRRGEEEEYYDYQLLLLLHYYHYYDYY